MAIDAVTKNGLLGGPLGVPSTRGGNKNPKKKSVVVATPPKPKGNNVKGTGPKGASTRNTGVK